MVTERHPILFLRPRAVSLSFYEILAEGVNLGTPGSPVSGRQIYADTGHPPCSSCILYCVAYICLKYPANRNKWELIIKLVIEWVIQVMWFYYSLIMII